MAANEHNDGGTLGDLEVATDRQIDSFHCSMPSGRRILMYWFEKIPHFASSVTHPSHISCGSTDDPLDEIR